MQSQERVEEATVTTKGQLVVPARLRRRYGIKPGTRVRFIAMDRAILFQPVTSEYIRGLMGSLKGGPSITKELLEERRREKEREEADIKKWCKRS